MPNAKHITNTNSGHEIHKEQPQLVVEAIRDVVDAVRSGNRLEGVRVEQAIDVALPIPGIFGHQPIGRSAPLRHGLE